MAGHVWRVQDAKVMKLVMKGRVGTKRKRETARTMWIVSINKDLNLRSN